VFMLTILVLSIIKNSDYIDPCSGLPMMTKDCNKVGPFNQAPMVSFDPPSIIFRRSHKSV
jgi:hypothetical protein